MRQRGVMERDPSSDHVPVVKPLLLLILGQLLLGNPQEEWQRALGRANTLRRSDPAAARTGFQAAANLARQAGSQPLILVWMDLADFLIQHSQYREAEAILHSARGLFNGEPAVSSKAHGDVLHLLAVTYRAQDRREESMEVLRKEITILEGATGSDQALLLPAVNLLTFLCLETGRIEEARLLNRRAISIAKRSGNARTMIQPWIGLSELENSAGSYDAARRAARNAQKLADPLRQINAPLYELAHNQLARISYETADYRSAALHWKLVLDSMNTWLPGADQRVLSLRKNIALVAFSRGHIDEAEKELLSIIQLAEQHAHHVALARGLYVLGTVYAQQNQFEKASTTFIRSLAIADRQLGELSPDSAMCLVGLARLYMKKGQPLEAVKYSGRVARISGDDHAITMVWVDLMRLHAEVMRKLRRKDEAKEIDGRVATIMTFRRAGTHIVDVTELPRR